MLHQQAPKESLQNWRPPVKMVITQLCVCVCVCVYRCRYQVHRQMLWMDPSLPHSATQMQWSANRRSLIRCLKWQLAVLLVIHLRVTNRSELLENLWQISWPNWKTIRQQFQIRLPRTTWTMPGSRQPILALYGSFPWLPRNSSRM